MNNYSRAIRRVAILGAGVMGAQIAAHFANAGLTVLLFELSAEKGDKNANVKKALAMLSKLKPAPFADSLAVHYIQPANYVEDLPKLRDCDLVIEAISERLDWKHDLYAKVMTHLGERTILATNTSGISIEKLAEGISEAYHSRFCGVHFFNPPRYMHLLELIPHSATDAKMLDLLEGFFTSVLGKGVIRAKDTPGFIGNRIGILSMLAVMHHAERLKLSFDLVDKLTGVGIGRPKSATFRTADVVGLDTFAHVVDSLKQALPNDPWNACFQVPAWARKLIENGDLGQKAGAGVYTKQGRDIHVLQPESMQYRRVQSALDDDVRSILKIRKPDEKLDSLLKSDSPQADFLLSIHMDLFHYAAFHLAGIAHSARDIDLAMRWGYGWTLGPFEMWQAAGWQRICGLLQEHVSQGKAMAGAALPEWVVEDDRKGVHDASGSWSADSKKILPGSSHPVYARQVFPNRILNEPLPASQTVFEDDAVRMWHTGDDIAVLSFKTKMHSVSNEVLDGILQAVQVAEEEFQGLVLWQPEAPFCAGANLLQVITQVSQGDIESVREVVEKFQQASMALRHSSVPTVAAVQGLALGGGCEFILHCDRVVAALESYIGLVEVGVGLIPAGGGCKEMAQRACDDARGGDIFPFLAEYFERIAMGKVAGSASEAREWHYLRSADSVVFNAFELLHVAKAHALAIYESGYSPPKRRENIRVAGRRGIANFTAQLVNMLQGGFISEYDFEIGRHLSRALCGGEVDPNTEVSDEWLLKLEVEGFMTLLKQGKTQQRIQHMLENGKPLRN